MFFVPALITNFIFIGTVYLCIFQLVKLKHDNPVLHLQFIMGVFSLVMIVVVALYNRTDPWLSMGFLVVAVVSATVMYRQLRWLPPSKPLD